MVAPFVLWNRALGRSPGSLDKGFEGLALFLHALDDGPEGFTLLFQALDDGPEGFTLLFQALDDGPERFALTPERFGLAVERSHGFDVAGIFALLAGGPRGSHLANAVPDETALPGPYQSGNYRDGDRGP